MPGCVAALLCCLVIASSAAGENRDFAPVWTASSPGLFPVSACFDRAGSGWVGYEDDGLLYLPANGLRTHFGVVDGLGDGTVNAVCGDARGRIWVGHQNHGVSVWNGRGWRNYPALSGPLGAHVFALNGSARGGRVWIAT